MLWQYRQAIGAQAYQRPMTAIDTMGIYTSESRRPREIFIPQILILQLQNDEIYTVTFHLCDAEVQLSIAED
jgi:hypothetical protein